MNKLYIEYLFIIEYLLKTRIKRTCNTVKGSEYSIGTKKTK